MTKSRASHGADPEVISGIGSAARFLGVSRPVLSANLASVPHRRVGRRLVFSRAALLSWLEGERRAA